MQVASSHKCEKSLTGTKTAIKPDWSSNYIFIYNLYIMYLYILLQPYSSLSVCDLGAVTSKRGELEQGNTLPKNLGHSEDKGNYSDVIALPGRGVSE